MSCRSLFMWCHSFMRTWSLWQWRSCDVTILFVPGVCDIDEVVMSPFCAYLDSAWFNLIKFVDVYVSWIFWPEEVVMSSFFAYLDSVETDLVWRVSGGVAGGQDISVTWQHGRTTSGIICKGQTESELSLSHLVYSSRITGTNLVEFDYFLKEFKVYKWTDRWLPNKIRPQIYDQIKTKSAVFVILLNKTKIFFFYFNSKSAMCLKSNKSIY